MWHDIISVVSLVVPKRPQANCARPITGIPQQILQFLRTIHALSADTNLFRTTLKRITTSHCACALLLRIVTGRMMKRTFVSFARRHAIPRSRLRRRQRSQTFGKSCRSLLRRKSECHRCSGHQRHAPRRQQAVAHCGARFAGRVRGYVGRRGAAASLLLRRMCSRPTSTSAPAKSGSPPPAGPRRGTREPMHGACTRRAVSGLYAQPDRRRVV